MYFWHPGSNVYHHVGQNDDRAQSEHSGIIFFLKYLSSFMYLYLYIYVNIYAV